MPDDLTALAMIPAVGVTAQWVAWRLGLPSILILLSAGLLMGAGLQLLDPDELFGDLLEPGVSLAVGLILFEGGLSLTRAELRSGQSVLPRLLALGVPITLAAAALLGVVVLDLPLSVAAIIGALLTVTGPTVVGPLLTTIRVRGATGPILKAEGILIDPIGAVLATLVFHVAVAHEGEDKAAEVLVGLLKFAAVGLGIGLAAAFLGGFLLRRYLLPDAMLAAFGLALALLVIAVADELVEESGLLAVTITGMALGTQRPSEVRHLLEFNETVRTLLIASLFVILGAQVTRDQISDIGWDDAAFVIALIVAVRPLVALVATARSTLSSSERGLIALMAPRGIVAASTASIFALRLQGTDIEGADEIVPVVFLTVLGTIAFYGLTAGPYARRVGLADHDPQGVLVIGANPLAVAVASALRDEGFRVLVNDRDATNTNAARAAGLEVHDGAILSDTALSELDLRGIGRLLSLTDDETFTALAAQRFAAIFGRRELYQLPPAGSEGAAGALAAELRIRPLFSAGLGYEALTARLERGARVRTIAGLAGRPPVPSPGAIVLFVVGANHRLQVAAADGHVAPGPRDRLLVLS